MMARPLLSASLAALIATPAFAQQLLPAPSTMLGGISSNADTNGGVDLLINGVQHSWLLPNGTQPQLILTTPSGGGGEYCISREGTGNFWCVAANNNDMFETFYHTIPGVDKFASWGVASDGCALFDGEPDLHGPKGHSSCLSTSFGTTTVTIDASQDAGGGCGTGAAFDPGSNDSGGRLTVGTSPGASCAIVWMHNYTNETGSTSFVTGYENAAPACGTFQSEGHRATAPIIITGTPVNNDTITVEGVAYTLVTGTPSGPQIKINGVNGTATNIALFFKGQQIVPLTVPGSVAAGAHYDASNNTPGTAVLTYTFKDGVKGNAVALSTSDPTNITVPGNFSGGALPVLAEMVSGQCGTGGATITAMAVTGLVAGQVISWGLPSGYW